MNKLVEFWDKKTKLVFISAVIAMVATHGFGFANILYSHDSLAFWNTSVEEKVRAGRWLVPYFINARKISTTWEMGIFSILYISLAVVLITKILEFTEVQGVCTAVALSTSIALTSLFSTYIHDADADCMGILLACFAVYAFKYFPKVINVIVSIISMVLCLGIYQAHFCVSIGLFVLLVIYQSKDIKNWKDVLTVFITGIKEVVTIMVSFVLYMQCMKWMTKHYGVEVSVDYNGPGKLSGLSIQTILQEIPGAYRYFKNEFLEIRAYNSAEMINVYKLLLIVLLVSVIAYLWINKPFAGSLLLIIPCIIAMPLALNAIYVVSFRQTHMLMIFAFRLAVLLPMVFINMTADRIKGKGIWKKIPQYIKQLLCAVTAISIFFISFNSMVYANGAYLVKKLMFDNTTIHAQAIWQDVNCLEGYLEGQTEVVFMGTFENSRAQFYSPLEEGYSYNLLGTYFTPLTYDDTIDSFYKAVLGRRMIVSHDCGPYEENQEYLDMPSYPTTGYCKMIDGKAVVKLTATPKSE